jgi:TonB family protein
VNGGGEVLRLRAMEGNIQLRYVDEVFQRQQELVQQQFQQEAEMELRYFNSMVQQGMQEMQKQMQQNLGQNPTPPPAPAQPVRTPTAPVLAATPRAINIAPAPPAQPPPAQTEILRMKLDEFWWGGVRVDPVEQEARRVKEVRPVYPDVARQAGIEGIVSMSVLINKDGTVEKVEVLSGEQALRDAAVTAVRQWRYRPFVLDGTPVPVLTTVNLGFRIQ